MKNKKILILAIIFFIFAFIIQALSIGMRKDLSTDAFCVLAISSAIPLSLCEWFITRLLPSKVVAIKYIIYVHIIGILIGFVVVCFVAAFSEIKMVDGMAYF